VKVVVLADTHTRGASRPVPRSAWVHLESADRILHAGDVCDPALLDELASFAPVSVVMGNCDAWDVKEWGAPERADLELDGIRIGMVHDSGVRSGRRKRLRQLFPHARVAVFGHSHLPVNEDADGLLLLNPGSPTWKRQAPWPSMGLLWIEDGEVEGEVFPV
jgi:hypothetical protein